MSVRELEFLTNEPVEGQSLAERLAQGALPAEEALRYAIDIGSALHRAHSRGVVHGKISAHLILLTPGGARILRPTDMQDDWSLAYRSPEQVRGEAADLRSDIFSYGVVLYELATSRPAFSGEGAALDRAILERPPATLLGKSPIHAAMEGVIAGCIEKDPGRRRQRVQNAVTELKLAGRSMTRMAAARPRPKQTIVEQVPEVEQIDVRPQRPRIFSPVQFPDEIQAVAVRPGNQRMGLWLLSIFAVIVLAGGSWMAWLMLHQSTPQVVNFTAVPPDNTTYRMPAISPDGRYLAVQLAGPEGKPMLWLRALDALTATPIPETEGGFAPFWSPDSQYVAFFADKMLKKIKVSGGPAERICDAEVQAGGGTWNEAGDILFAPGQGTALYQVSASGGTARPVTKLNPGKFEHAHLWPQFLPDGKHFIFFALSDSPAATGVYTGALDSPDTRILFASETNAVYSAPAGTDSSRNGYLLYVRDRSLMGIRFNPGRLQVQGDARPVNEDVGALQSLSLAPISVSQNGILVYQSVGAPTRQLAWVDRSGKPLAPVSLYGEWGPPRIAPDGSRAVVAKLGEDRKAADLWMIDRAGNASQFTSGPGHKGSPVWSPDASRIAYFFNRDNDYNLVIQPSAGGTAVPVLNTAQPKYPTDWSRDNKYLLFGSMAEGTRWDVWGLSLANRQAGPILDTIASENYGVLSPDGKWLAFQSDEAGRNQVYVQSFDGISRGTRRRYQISTEDGGGVPRWSVKGSELFYLSNTGHMMAAATHPQGLEFQNDPPVALFQTKPIPNTWNLYDVAADGQRFLINTPMEWSSAAPVTVLTNWTEKLKD